MTKDWKDALQMLAAEAGPVEPEPDAAASAAPADEMKPQRLEVIYERKGRKGKPVTIIAGFDWPDDLIARLLGELQRALGRGGSSRGGEILLQGDCREAVTSLLRQRGHSVRP